MTDAEQPEDQDVNGLLIATSPTPDGHYRLEISRGQDSLILDRDGAAAYADTLLLHWHRAVYDALVLRQFTGAGISPSDAAITVQEMRADRPPAPETGPFTFTPGVTGTLIPFLHVLVHGREVGTWRHPEVLEHHWHVVSASKVVDLDNDYRRMLRTLDFEPHVVSSMVGALCEERRVLELDRWA